MLVYNTPRHSVRKDKKHLNKYKYSVALRASGAELIHHKDGLVPKVPVIAADSRAEPEENVHNRFSIDLQQKMLKHERRD